MELGHESDPPRKAPFSPLRLFIGSYMISSMLGWVSALRYGTYFYIHFLMVVGCFIAFAISINIAFLNEKEERECIVINTLLWSQTILLIGGSALFDAFFG